MALTDREQEFLDLVDMLPEEQTNPADYQPWFNADLQDTDFGTKNMLRMIGNVPYSAYKAAEDLVTAGVREPMLIGEKLINGAFGEGTLNLSGGQMGLTEMAIRGIAGAGEIAGNASGISAFSGEETQNAAVARALGQFFIDRYGSLDAFTTTMVEDPFGVASDVAGLALGGIRNAPRAMSAVRNVSPLRAASPALSGVNRGLDAVTGAGRPLHSMSTGYDTAAIRRVQEASRAGGDRRANMLDALRGRIDGDRIVTQFTDVFEKMRTARRQEYLDGLAALRMKPGEQININPIRKSVFDQLFKPTKDNGLGIKYKITKTGRRVLDFSESAIPRSTQARSQSIIRDLVDRLDRANGAMDFRELDALKRYVGELRDWDKEAEIADTVVTKAYDMIRSDLGRKVDGYADLTKDYEDMSNSLRLLRVNLSAGAPNPETTLTKLTGILKDNNNATIRKNVLELVEKFGGGSIADQVAGLTMSQNLPKGLFGRGTLWGLGGAGTIAAWGANPFTVGLGTLGALSTSPRAVAELYQFVGASQRQIDTITAFLDDLNARVPEALTDGLVVAEALERAQSRITDKELEAIEAEKRRRRDELLMDMRQPAQADALAQPQIKGLR